MRRLPPLLALGVIALTAPLATAHAQQGGVTLSPFVTFLPTGSASPMAGLSISLAGGPIAVRAGGHLAVQERGATAATDLATRPWGVDADAVAFLEGFGSSDFLALIPYVFTGVSNVAIDSASLRLNRQGWSYGTGLTLPMGGSFGLFGEARWRMSRFVMPDAADAPAATREFRFGMSFRVGSGGSAADLIHLIAMTQQGEPEDSSETTSSSSRLSQLLAVAGTYIGAPFRLGGMSTSGFDAAGFVRFIFSKFGVMLPRTSSDQARVGDRVRADWNALEPGDLVMFQDDSGINHVAIYVGHKRILHSSETGGGVRYDDLTTDRGRWFSQHLVAARRVKLDSRGTTRDLTRGIPDNSGYDKPDHAPRASLTRRP
jgi:cell wall-associated NlpC family hydrolase